MVELGKGHIHIETNVKVNESEGLGGCAEGGSVSEPAESGTDLGYIEVFTEPDRRSKSNYYKLTRGNSSYTAYVSGTPEPDPESETDGE